MKNLQFRQGNRWMASSKGSHGPGRFIRHLRMKRALGIPSSHRMWPARQMRGRDRRRGIWFDHKLKCIAIEGKDFAQDTEEGGADRYELLPDSDEEEGGKSLLGDDDEYVPETEPQDVVTMSKIAGPWAYQGPRRLGTMLHDWRDICREFEQQQEICKVDNKLQMDNVKFEKENAKVEMDRVKFENKSTKLEVESNKFDMLCAKVQMGSVKLEQESANVEMESDKLDMLRAKDGVDLRGHSQVEDDEFNEQVIDMITNSIPAYKDVFKSSKR